MKRWLKSITTDADWDPDATKILGLVMVVAGVIGWLVLGRDPTYVMGFGSALVAAGKFSAQG